ncbi:MAG: excinuclease ABC subunit UvrB [Thermanaerothrix sp.]|nr:excinuclease ABC subunit UvrB [Thermanaerothrix sp.]
MSRFVLKSPWPPAGDQPKAIDLLVEGVRSGLSKQTLLGVTGSGKTFTMAKVIEALQRPALVLAHNKTLAAQLYSEFKEFFPENAVQYFVSYYDYYQPEAYLPAQDVYIEKDASINDRIEKLRLAATKALVERRDVIVVASVSCIYGLGKRKNYEDAIFRFRRGEIYPRREFMGRLVDIFYARNDVAFEPGTFRVRGDAIDVYPSYSDTALRVVFMDDEVEEILEIDSLTLKTIERKEEGAVFPAQHYVTDKESLGRALRAIEEELQHRLKELKDNGKLLEAQRLESRTRYDIEMLAQVGYCSGIENYSRHLEGRLPGEPPGTLMDFFPDDYLLFIDESHITIPQVRGMYNGDRARKEVLVEHGFRLPSCLDNRPLRFDEFEEYMKTVFFVSATPGDYELSISQRVVEQIIRPTGVLDPVVEVRPASNQVEDLIGELRAEQDMGGCCLVTTLTKRSAEDLSQYIEGMGIKVRYIHGDLNAFERAELLRDLRARIFSTLVGVNLLREGIDLPEVSLVAILEADKEGYLRSFRSLIQMIGRAARNNAGRVILYGDSVTESMRRAMEETLRRRRIQEDYNNKMGIEPRSVVKEIRSLLPEDLQTNSGSKVESSEGLIDVEEMERLMWEAVARLDFEEAARLRDSIAMISERGKKIGGHDKDKRGKATQPSRGRRRHS